MAFGKCVEAGFYLTRKGFGTGSQIIEVEWEC